MFTFITSHIFNKWLQIVKIFRYDNRPFFINKTNRATDTIFGLVEKVKEKLASIPGTKNIKDNWGQRTKKLLVQINQPRARRAGVTSWDVAISLQTVLTGLETAQYREEDEVVPIVLRTVADERLDIGKLESHNIYAQQTGLSVPLKQIADIGILWQPAEIICRNRLKTVTILIILLLLVWQFDSIRKLFIIAVTIPLGLIGVVIGLLITRSYFGFMTILGIHFTGCIVVNNAIILLDRIKIEMDVNGLEPPDAIIQAAQRCLWFILITTATIIAGLMPLWLFGGPMWEPMAIAIIFGLAFCTLLTLEQELSISLNIFCRTKNTLCKYVGKFYT